MQSDWSTVFEEAYPQLGATEDEIARFIAEIRHPISASEADAIDHSRAGLFPDGATILGGHRAYASGWAIPARPLPASYLSLLRHSNGGEFRNGARWFQFFPINDPRCGVRAMLIEYGVPEHMPGALPVAFDGGGTFYLIDLRHPAIDGEYPVVCAGAADLGWEVGASWRIAESFLEALQGNLEVHALRPGVA